MTRVQVKLTALIAALALVACCALGFAAPKQAYADTTAGDTFAKAKVLDYSKKKNLSISDPGWFNSKEMSKFYKFSTTSRNSGYRIKVSDLGQQDLDVIIYDVNYREIARYSTEDRLSTTYRDLDRIGTYYVELRRDTNWTTRADYKITLKELITPPNAVTKLKATSTSSGKVTVSYSWPTDATGFQVRTKRGWGSGKATSFKTTSKKVTYKVTYSGKKYPYKISVRPYRKINGEFYYGPWSNSVTVRAK